MLFTREVLDGVAEGRIDLAFRTWRSPRVHVGSRLRTAVGVIEVVSVDLVRPTDISESEARRAGFACLDDLLGRLRAHVGTPYRIGMRYGGEDRRDALRERDDLTDEEVDEVRGRLARLDRASPHGAWTLRVLELIDQCPATSSAELAARVGRERARFKADVRKLKELGLTESLDVGYRLSPRGRAALTRLWGGR
ncbi:MULTISPECIES: hypothetical protein [unclassified Streptomyces]|uniref:hypothetical protein n=1 Tax=unclassified Streptomyces TaxID=2593676 RepID=UPI003318AA26